MENEKEGVSRTRRATTATQMRAQRYVVIHSTYMPGERHVHAC